MANIIEIKDFSAPELDLYARLNENQLLRYYEPQTGLLLRKALMSSCGRFRQAMSQSPLLEKAH